MASPAPSSSPSSMRRSIPSAAAMHGWPDSSALHSRRTSPQRSARSASEATRACFFGLGTAFLFALDLFSLYLKERE
eukprot:3675710-Pleurochrysis_carterae.AAC.1